jgi:hypothetical protein
MRRVLIIAAAGGLLIAVVVAILLGVVGHAQTRLAAKCKTLSLGMTEKDIVATLGMAPRARARVERGPLLIERLFFGGTIMPGLAAQPVYVDLQATTGRALRIVCDEDFDLKGDEIKELEKKGIF